MYDKCRAGKSFAQEACEVSLQVERESYPRK